MRHQPASSQPMAPTAAELTVVGSGADSGRRVLLGPDAALLGRARSCDLVLVSDQVSRRHAAVHWQDGEYVVEDLGSVNGTYVNGERVTAPRTLRDGDWLVLADVPLRFRLRAGLPVQRRHEPGTPPDWSPDAATAPMASTGTLPAGTTSQPHSLRRDLHDAPGFNARALLTAVLGSVVGTVLLGTLGTSQWATLGGAALGPLLSAAFSTGRGGTAGRVRVAAIALLSAAALAITVSGFTLAEVVADKPVLPGQEHRPTFPVGPVGPQPTPTGTSEPEPTPTGTSDTEPTPTEGPTPTESPTPTETPPAEPAAGALTGSTDCQGPDAEGAYGCLLALESIGDSLLTVSEVAIGEESLDGADATGTWSVQENCSGQGLTTGALCDVSLRLDPQWGPGTYTATIVVDSDAEDGPITATVNAVAVPGPA